MESEQKANKNRTKANKMRTVTQRVQHASVTIDGQLKSKIGKGLLVLVGIEDKDTQEDIEWLAKKITNLRIFDDENGGGNFRLKFRRKGSFGNRQGCQRIVF